MNGPHRHRRSLCAAALSALLGSLMLASPQGGAQPAPAGAGRCPADHALLPAGSFTMGEADLKDNPRRQVNVGAVCLKKTEVTVTEYAACVQAGACKPAATRASWPKATRAQTD